MNVELLSIQPYRTNLDETLFVTQKVSLEKILKMPSAKLWRLCLEHNACMQHSKCKGTVLVELTKDTQHLTNKLWSIGEFPKEKSFLIVQCSNFSELKHISPEVNTISPIWEVKYCYDYQKQNQFPLGRLEANWRCTITKIDLSMKSWNWFDPILN